MTDLGVDQEVLVHQILLGLPLENAGDPGAPADGKCSLRPFLVLVCRWEGMRARPMRPISQCDSFEISRLLLGAIVSRVSSRAR